MSFGSFSFLLLATVILSISSIGSAQSGRFLLPVYDAVVRETPDGLVLKTGPAAYDEFFVHPVASDHLVAGVDAINRSAKDAKSDERAILCDRMIEISVGGRGGNTSYGAYCVVRGPGGIRRAKVCYDELIGHFLIQAVDGRKPTDSDLAKFIGGHCWGG